ncbi:hypothetical protein V6N13_096191 [Hibiscus sabdariffa]
MKLKVYAISSCYHFLQDEWYKTMRRSKKVDIKCSIFISVAERNPMKQLPAIVDGRFYLFESHAILILLVHFLELQTIGIRLMFPREVGYIRCWIGITPTYIVVQVYD